LNKALIKRLNAHYKFVMEDDKQSIIEKTITEISREIVYSLWIPVGVPKEHKAFMNNEGYLVIPNAINDTVCEFVEFINSPTAKV
jgi:hypothetical protein